MTRLMCGHCDDVREAASYAPKEPMPMTPAEAVGILDELSTRWAMRRPDWREAALLAIAALRVQAEPGRQRDYEADIERLTKQRDASEAARCESLNDVRAAQQIILTLERALRLALDALDAKEAGL